MFHGINLIPTNTRIRFIRALRRLKELLGRVPGLFGDDKARRASDDVQ